MHRGKTRALFAAATIAAYLAAFFLPAWHDSSVPSGWFGPSFHGQTISGAGAFVMALFVIGLPMWLANPAFWFGLFSLGLFSLGRGWPRAAKISSAIAVLLALSELPVFWREVHVGYWVWLGSIGLLAVLCFSRSPQEATQSCPLTLQVVWGSLVLLAFIIGALLLRWNSSFGFENLSL